MLYITNRNEETRTMKTLSDGTTTKNNADWWGLVETKHMFSEELVVFSPARRYRSKTKTTMIRIKKTLGNNILIYNNEKNEFWGRSFLARVAFTKEGNSFPQSDCLIPIVPPYCFALLFGTLHFVDARPRRHLHIHDNIKGAFSAVSICSSA